MEFKSTLTFTNSNNSNVQGNFKPLEKTKQELMLEERDNQNLKFTSKKEQEERRKKM